MICHDQPCSLSRPVYVWGPQLFNLQDITKCGPCELYELTTLAEAYAFAPKVAAHGITESLSYVRDAFGPDLILTDVSHRASVEAGLTEESTIVRWDKVARRTTDAGERAVAVIRMLDEGEQALREATEEAARYYATFDREGFDLLSRVELTVPSLAAFQRYQLSRHLLAAIETPLLEKLEVLAGLTRTRGIPVPPMAALVLRKCRSGDDIVDALSRLRKEFEDTRREMGKYETALDLASSLGDQIDALNDIQAARERIAKTVASSEGLSSTTTLVRYAWDIGKQGSLMKAGTKAVDVILDLLQHRRSRRLAGRFVDIYKQLREVDGYPRLLERVFGEQNVDFRSFDRFEVVNKRLNALHSTR